MPHRDSGLPTESCTRGCRWTFAGPAGYGTAGGLLASTPAGWFRRCLTVAARIFWRGWSRGRWRGGGRVRLGGSGRLWPRPGGIKKIHGKLTCVIAQLSPLHGKSAARDGQPRLWRSQDTLRGGLKCHALKHAPQEMRIVHCELSPPFRVV